MLRITIKNLLKNKVLNLCLVTGFILSIAVMCAIPTYSKSILNNYIKLMFSSETMNQRVENSTQNKYTYPASLNLTKIIKTSKDLKKLKADYEALMKSFYDEAAKLPVPITAEKTTLSLNQVKFYFQKDGKDYYSSQNEVKYISDFYNHIKITEGKVPSDELTEDNVVEVVTDKTTFDNYSLQLNKPYSLMNVIKEKPLKMIVVGIFEESDKKDPYWIDKSNKFYGDFMVSEKSLFNVLEKNPDYISSLDSLKFDVIYDVNGINSDNATAAYKKGLELEGIYKDRANAVTSSEISRSLKQYVQKESLYNTIIWIFLIPVLVIVIYYIWMVSGFIVDADSEQIAVLKSRGAGKFEILRLYLYEGLILCIIGLITGPPLSLMICKAISYSDGFLVFNSSQGIDILISSKVYLYAFITVIILLLTLLTSVYVASQRSIVEVKSSKNRYYKVLFNNKYMDIILLAISLYGYYNFGIKKNVAVLSKANSENAPVDPLLYIISTIFIIGSGMFLLRLYRYLMNLIFKIGGRKYHTPVYISIINVLRHHLKKSAAMLFIVITVAIGIFDMYIAKDINTSFINTVKVTQGADFRVKTAWGSKVEAPYMDAGEPAPPMVTYFEPPYQCFSKLEGTEGFTKVLNTYDAQVQLATSDTATSCILSGIIPHEFGKIAYFDGELLNTHWYNYLNEMTKRKDFILISKGLAATYNYKKGDTLYYKIASGLNVKGVVLDIVDYWPGYSNLESRNLVIGNFDYIFKKLKIYPYEIWIKKIEGASDQTVYNSIKGLDMELTYFDNLANKLYYEKSDIFLKGTNSILNLSFLAIAAIATLGFIIYWMISLRMRTLSFGIYRSLGISSSGITLTLVLEQFLTLGTSMLIGLASGNLVGLMFIPLIKELWYKNKFVIPAHNLTYLKEYLQLGMMLVILFAASFIVLTRYIARLKVNQAIKLGED